MTKLIFSTLFLLTFTIHGISQKSSDDFIHEKWYFCDTTFFYNQDELILFSKDENACTNPTNYKSGSLELKNDGTFTLVNNLPCGPPIPTENGFIIDGCTTTSEGKFRIEKNYIWFDDILFNIDVIDEQFLLLRKEK